MTQFYTQLFSDQCHEFSVIIEDDGRVCYAYLLLRQEIIGDVWLYNQSATPIQTAWNREDMPFLNPVEYIKEELGIPPITSEKEIKAIWSFFLHNCELDQVSIYI